MLVAAFFYGSENVSSWGHNVRYILRVELSPLPTDYHGAEATHSVPAQNKLFTISKNSTASPTRIATLTYKDLNDRYFAKQRCIHE